MSFHFSAKAIEKLLKVKPELQRVVRKALVRSDTDFSVFESLRSFERQKKMVETGASKTMNSRHLTGHAVDLVPWIDGGLRWDWPLIYRIAAAMKIAAIEENVSIVWGGVWDRSLNDLDDDLEHEVALYVLRKKQAGQKAFTDGPHFELNRKAYP